MANSVNSRWSLDSLELGKPATGTPDYLKKTDYRTYALVLADLRHSLVLSQTVFPLYNMTVLPVDRFIDCVSHSYL